MLEYHYSNLIYVKHNEEKGFKTFIKDAQCASFISVYVNVHIISWSFWQFLEVDIPSLVCSVI